MTQSKIKSIIGTLVVLSVIVAWASGNKGPQDRTGLTTWEDNLSSCLGACQTRMGTIYGCQNANQEECYKYTDWEKWKSGTCVWLEGFGYYCDVGDDDESDDGGDRGDDGDGGCGDDDCYEGCY